MVQDNANYTCSKVILTFQWAPCHNSFLLHLLDVLFAEA